MPDWHSGLVTALPNWALSWVSTTSSTANREYQVIGGGTTGYIVSIDAAIAIAEGETKGKGHLISQYLIGFRKNLAKQRLSTKGNLSDFIGLKPTEPAPASMLSETPRVSEVSEPTTAQPTLFDAVPQRPVEDVTKRDALADATISAVIDEQSTDDNASVGNKLNGKTADNHTPALSSNEKPDPTHETKLPSAATLLLQTAQLLLQQAQLLVDHEQRLQETRSTVGQIVAIGQQSALQTLGLSAGGEQPPQQTLRSRIRQIVNYRCRKTGELQDQVYAFIYNRLYYLYGVSVASHHRQKDESYLELCERLGILDKVYSIVTSHEFTVALNEAPVQPRAEAA
jgi:hypothetical protein